MKHRSLPLLLALSLCALGQNGSSFEPRLNVSTLVREDIFAGFLTNDMERLAKGERNLELLLQERPPVKSHVLAWQGGVALYRATRAHEQKQASEFDRHYNRSEELFKAAAALAPESEAVAAITGGSHILFMDRLPEKQRMEASGKAYSAYQFLMTKQGPVLEKLPVHHRGEVLAGLAQSAQRTGRSKEAEQTVDKIIAMLPNTPYEARARKWKESPELAGRTTIACMTCHEEGKLETRRAALPAQP